MLQEHALFICVYSTECAFKSVKYRALEGIEDHYQVLTSRQQDVLSIWRKLHISNLFCLALNCESLERLVLVILSIE